MVDVPPTLVVDVPLTSVVDVPPTSVVLWSYKGHTEARSLEPRESHTICSVMLSKYSSPLT